MKTIEFYISPCSSTETRNFAITHMKFSNISIKRSHLSQSLLRKYYVTAIPNSFWIIGLAKVANIKIFLWRPLLENGAFAFWLQSNLSPKTKNSMPPLFSNISPISSSVLKSWLQKQTQLRQFYQRGQVLKKRFCRRKEPALQVTLLLTILSFSMKT